MTDQISDIYVSPLNISGSSGLAEFHIDFSSVIFENIFSSMNFDKIFFAIIHE